MEYVVQTPAQYQQKFEKGEYFIKLIRKKQQQVIQDNPFQDICNSYYNIVVKKQLAQIAYNVAETYKIVIIQEKEIQ